MALKMEFGEVINRGNNLKNDGVEKVNELKSWLDSIVYNQLPEIWEGSGYQGYQERYKVSTDNNFKEIINFITELGDAIVKNAMDYQEFDEAHR